MDNTYYEIFYNDGESRLGWRWYEEKQFDDYAEVEEALKRLSGVPTRSIKVVEWTPSIIFEFRPAKEKYNRG